LSFFASNNRIRVTNDADKTIFDTAQPMPHIVQRLQVSTSVGFPNAPGRYWMTSAYLGESSLCQKYEQKYSCQLEYVCNGGTCSYQNVCAYRMEWVKYPAYLNTQGFEYDAYNWSTVVDLGAIANGIEADFIIANCIAYRTAQGSIIDVGPIPCGLPLGASFLANNSSIIESTSDVADGSPWLTRMMSLFVQNGHVYVEFKHSSRGVRQRSQWEGGLECNWSGPPSFVGNIPRSVPSNASSFQFTFDILIGKFTTP